MYSGAEICLANPVITWSFFQFPELPTIREVGVTPSLYAIPVMSSPAKVFSSALPVLA